MKYTIQKSIYPITFLFIVFFSGCHSLPPSEPPDTEQEFDPRQLPWEEVSMPVNLTGDWYMGGKIHLTVAEDTLRVQGTWSLIQSLDKSGSYYRIIYKIEQQYYAMYCRNLTENQVQIIYTDSTATDAEGAVALRLVQPWYTVTSGTVWVSAEMPGDLTGNWHIQDGKMEMVIDRENVALEGEIWEIEAAQTNYKLDRIILKRSGNYKSLYFEKLSTYSMDVLLVDGREDIQDRYGNVPGERSSLCKWWDFIEEAGFYQGSHWIYFYFYYEEHTRVNNTSSPIDSIFQKRKLLGYLEIEVTNSTIQEGTGDLTLQTTFRIDEDSSRYYHALKNDTGEVVITDSSWINYNVVKTEQYEIFLENDTLWFDTEEGKVLFSSTKVHPNALMNIQPFVYPFTFPREDFPEGRNIITEIKVEGALSQIEHVTPYFQTVVMPNSGNIPVIIWGGFIEKRASFEPGKNLYGISYKYGNCDRRYWSGDEQYLNPYFEETRFVCSLTGFTPGQ